MKFMNQKGVMHLLPILVLAILLTGVVVAVQSTGNRGTTQDLRSQAATFNPTTRTFLETFDGFPTAPQPYQQTAWYPNFAVSVHERDDFPSFPTVDAQHGADCAAPIDSTNPGDPRFVTHRLTGEYAPDAVFQCRGHMMTGFDGGGYGEIIFAPNHMVDFSQGEAVIKVDVSSFRTSSRDWWDLTVTPFNDNVALPSDSTVDLQGFPRNSVNISMHQSHENRFVGLVTRNGAESELPVRSMAALQSIAPLNAARRDTYELRISQTKVKFCLISINYTPGSPGPQGQTAPVPANACWIDSTISPLTFTQGIVQFGHHGYTPDKGCVPGVSGFAGCANTWHWDNISIAPAIPFTIIHTPTRSGTGPIVFDAPAPANAFLQFSARGRVEVSFNNGVTWQVAPKQAGTYPVGVHPEYHASYFIPIPEGVQSARFRLSPDEWLNSNYFTIKDFVIWSQTVNGVTPAPTSTPLATVVPTASPTPQGTVVPTVSPTPRPTNTPTPRPTNIPTPVPTIVPTPTVTPTPIAGATSTPQPANTWTASYYRWSGSDASRGLNGTPLLTRTLGNTLNLNWRWGSPAANVPRNNFSARFTKRETFAGGTYRFTIRNDDGVRVYVDGQLITTDATYWRDQAATTRTVQTSITPGDHTVTVEYYENRGRAQVAVSWTRL